MRSSTPWWRVHCFPVVKSKIIPGVLGGLALLLGGAGLHQLQGRALSGSEEDRGPAPVGGYRLLLADWFWLETNLAWESRDAARVRRLIDFTVRADPQTPYFWRNGARILAYDFPAWQCQGAPDAPRGVQAHWRERGAQEALQLLERGQAWHGESAVLHLEMANICLYALGDRQRAADHYRRAAALPDAPDYAGRISARLQGELAAGMTLTR